VGLLIAVLAVRLMLALAALATLVRGAINMTDPAERLTTVLEDHFMMVLVGPLIVGLVGQPTVGPVGLATVALVVHATQGLVGGIPVQVYVNEVYLPTIIFRCYRAPRQQFGACRVDPRVR